MEIIPFTLAENAGFEPLQMMSMLKAFHTKGEKTFGINIRKGTISDMFQELLNREIPAPHATPPLISNQAAATALHWRLTLMGSLRSA